MRALSSGWLVASLLVLWALVMAELHFRVGQGPSAPRLPAESSPAEPAPVPLFALAERGSFSATIERPLFLPNRQAVASEAPAPAPVAEAARPTANRYALSAIIIVDQQRIALLSDTTTGGLTRVREGERVAGWQVEKIGESSAVLRSGDTREELALRTFGPPPPPRSRQPARRADSEDAQSGQREGTPLAASPDRRRRRVRGPREPLPVPDRGEN